MALPRLSKVAVADRSAHRSALPAKLTRPLGARRELLAPTVPAMAPHNRTPSPSRYLQVPPIDITSPSAKHLSKPGEQRKRPRRWDVISFNQAVIIVLRRMNIEQAARERLLEYQKHCETDTSHVSTMVDRFPENKLMDMPISSLFHAPTQSSLCTTLLSSRATTSSNASTSSRLQAARTTNLRASDGTRGRRRRR